MNTEIKEMEITDYSIFQNLKAAFYRLWKLKFVVIFTTIIGALMSIVYITFLGDQYTYYTSASIYSAVYGSYTETVSGVTIMNTYSSLLGSTRVCERAAVEINNPTISAEYLKGLVSAGNVYFTGASTSSRDYGYRLQLYTRLSAPENVVEITNAMANAFVGEINELLGTDVIQVYDQAIACFARTVGSKMLYIAIFAAVGLFLSAGTIFVIEFFSSKVYLVSQCEMDKDLILGILPYSEKER